MALVSLVDFDKGGNNSKVNSDYGDDSNFQDEKSRDGGIYYPGLARKSVRQQKRNISNQIMLTVINCHQCRKLDVTTNILTCCNDKCRESYCMQCCKKYVRKFVLILFNFV